MVVSQISICAIKVVYSFPIRLLRIGESEYDKMNSHACKIRIERANAPLLNKVLSNIAHCGSVLDCSMLHKQIFLCFI